MDLDELPDRSTEPVGWTPERVAVAATIVVVSGVGGAVLALVVLLAGGFVYDHPLITLALVLGAGALTWWRLRRKRR